jgi:hypothetical protein
VTIVAEPSGVINVGLTEFVVEAVPTVTVTCEGTANSSFAKRRRL